MKKHTITTIQKLKNDQIPIVMITAYDALFAKLFEEYVDIILVGDSLNMSFLGKSDTLSASLEQMIYHTNAVCNGAPSSFVVCDMPFGTYNTKDEALKNAIRIYQETNADCVKIEGGEEKAEIIAYLVQNGIAVMGHIGLLPQSVRAEGGYKSKGKKEEEIAKLLKDAKAIESAGAFAMVIEGTKASVAKEISIRAQIPTIGIGAGVDTDGQVLVWSDMLGFFEAFKPKFVKEYLNGAYVAKNSVQKYASDVKERKFPTKEYEY